MERIKSTRQMQGLPCECGHKNKWGNIISLCFHCVGDFIGDRKRIKARGKKIEALWNVNHPDKVRARARRKKRRAKK